MAVADYLSRGGVLVRPVASGTDIGVDLYCETVVHKSFPFLHFWVQVKTGKTRISINKDGSAASYPFEKRHLIYWHMQPVPVFTFLVPIEDTSDDIRDIYIVNITQYTLTHDVSEKEQARISSEKKTSLNDMAMLNTFIHEVVPITFANMRIRDGVIAPVPTLTPSYVVYYHIGDLVVRYFERIMEQLRTTSTWTLNKLLSMENQVSAVKILRDIMWAFRDDGHYEVALVIARAAAKNKEVEKAKQYYQRAIKSIENDKNVCDLEEWKERKKQIEEEMQSLGD